MASQNVMAFAVRGFTTQWRLCRPHRDGIPVFPFHIFSGHGFVDHCGRSNHNNTCTKLASGKPCYYRHLSDVESRALYLMSSEYCVFSMLLRMEFVQEVTVQTGFGIIVLMKHAVLYTNNAPIDI